MRSLDKHEAVGVLDNHASKEHQSITTALLKTGLQVCLKSQQDNGIKEQSGSSQKMWRSNASSSTQLAGARTTSCVAPNAL